MLSPPVTSVLVDVRPLEALTDAELVDLLVAGEPDGGAELYRRYRTQVIRICASRGPRGRAEELCHETFCRFLEKAATGFVDNSRAGHYLLRIARNVAINASQRHHVRREISTGDYA